MQDISSQRCFNHSWREAVARCVSCSRHFCRECIVEHEDRMICAQCLGKLAVNKASRKKHFLVLFRAVLWVFGFVMIWLFFYTIGQGLLILPSSFHEGNIWQRSYWNAGSESQNE
jgi:hypothetical protein